MTILKNAKLKSGDIKTMLYLLIDGATLRQAAHGCAVTVRTALLGRDKILAVLKNAGYSVLSGEVWVDETYINVGKNDMIYSHKPGKGKRGLNKDLLQICCGVDSKMHCFAVAGGRGKMTARDAGKYYRGKSGTRQHCPF